jgi:DNA-directed RNA polymerase specialized sigma24 family protein
MVQISVSELPLKSTTLEVKVYVPAVVGVPEILPVVLSSVKPGGSEPETIEKVIDRFDPDRGEMLHFAYRILKNKIKNFFRDSSKNDALSVDVADEMPTPHDYTVMNEEAIRATTILKKLYDNLGLEEVRLITILQEQMETEGKYNVSVAARIMGIEPAKAHDVLRRIQRKLIKIKSGAVPRQASMKLPSELPPPDVQESVRFSGFTLGENETMLLLKQPDDFDEFAMLLADTKDIGIFMRISEYLKKIRP